MRSKETRFSYNAAASTFISERIDEQPDYAQATEVFEYIIRKNRKAGFAVSKWQPLAPRCFVVKIPALKNLAFFYLSGVKGNVTFILVFAVEFAPSALEAAIQ